jgi:agmatine deiminase
VVGLIKEIAPFVPVDLMVQDDAEFEATVKAQLDAAGVPLDRVRAHAIPHNDVWIRDMGPIFLTDGKGGLKIADFKFNMWGYEEVTSDNSLAEEKVDRLVAERLGLTTTTSTLISEGGNREVNGRGVLMATKAVEVQRNPSLTLEQIEAELKRVLGQKKVIWLEQGVADDDLTFRGPLPGGYFTVITTGGHIDEFARFADEDTILLAEVSKEQRDDDPIAAMTYDRLRVNEEILKKATDQDGKPFEIVRVPVPDKLFETMKAGDGVFDYVQSLSFDDGTVIAPDAVIDVVLPASYLNYIITNGLVIYQTYWQPGRDESMRLNDEKAKEILEKTFSPQRKVVGINAENVNLGGGGIHCISQQQPVKLAPTTP